VVLAEEPSDADQLLAMHKAGIDTNKNIELENWPEGFKESYISANRGEISYPTPDQMKSRFRPYINSTVFGYYRDIVDPIVKVLKDGALGWVIIQVEVKGTQGGEIFEFQSAWVELYEKRGGAWTQAGYVSKMKE